MICNYCGGKINSLNKIIGTDMYLCPHCKMINVYIKTKGRGKTLREVYKEDKEYNKHNNK